ncbi:MAG: hypothetical protein LBH06_04435 [Rikenellaceae bacterium]|jgi:hypothetical protein|nr:hypothetical protein [Rikenellaceae bacterium]
MITAKPRAIIFKRNPCKASGKSSAGGGNTPFGNGGHVDISVHNPVCLTCLLTAVNRKPISKTPENMRPAEGKSRIEHFLVFMRTKKGVLE